MSQEGKVINAKASELAIPFWRSGKTYARILGENNVEREIKNCLVKEAVNTAELDAEKANNQLEGHFHTLKNALRISDMKDLWYWFCMAFICLIFLILELVATLIFVKSPENSNKFLIFIVVLIIVELVLIATNAFVAWNSKTQTLKMKSLYILPSGLFHALPALCLSSGILILNFWLVQQTGYRQSPFLPAFLAAVLTIVGLPRENTPLTLLLSITASSLGIFSCFAESRISEEELGLILNSWGAEAGSEFPFYINAFTMGVSALLSIALRQFTFKVGSK